MQHNLTRILLVIELIPFAPIITDRIGENASRAIEVRCTDTAAHLWIALETMFGVLVPEVKGPVAAGSTEGAVHGVEGDGVDGVDVTAVVDRVTTVAFEAEVVALVFVVDVLDSASALDTPHREPGPICEGTHNPRLPFQWRLNRLEKCGRILEINDLNPALRGSNDEHLIPAHVHAVDAFLALDAGNGLLLPQIPVFDHFVPGAGDEHGAAIEHEGFHTADGLVVGGDLLGGGGACSKV